MGRRRSAGGLAPGEDGGDVRWDPPTPGGAPGAAALREGAGGGREGSRGTRPEAVSVARPRGIVHRRAHYLVMVHAGLARDDPPTHAHVQSVPDEGHGQLRGRGRRGRERRRAVPRGGGGGGGGGG